MDEDEDEDFEGESGWKRVLRSKVSLAQKKLGQKIDSDVTFSRFHAESLLTSRGS